MFDATDRIDSGIAKAIGQKTIESRLEVDGKCDAGGGPAAQIEDMVI